MSEERTAQGPTEGRGEGPGEGRREGARDGAAEMSEDLRGEERVEPVEGAELATETMARLYESQGFFEQARQARKGLFVQGLWELLEMGDAALSEPGIWVGRTEEELRCRWHLLADMEASLRARVPGQLLEARGADLALRFASIRGGRREYWDLHPVRSSGSCRLRPLEPLDALVVALGLRTGTGRFLPAFHAEPIWFSAS